MTLRNSNIINGDEFDHNGLATRVHPRVGARHPEIAPDDVVVAWERYVVGAVRSPGEVEVRIGFDGLGRMIEMAGVKDVHGWLVFHAQTPPTKRMMREIEMLGGGL